jgi:SAM-dependent methyltransferase
MRQQRFMRLLRNICSVLPESAREYILDLHARKRFHVESYRPETFFESWYRSSDDFHDRCTIGPEVEELRALYHYKSVERNIVEAIMSYLNESWVSNRQRLRVLDIGSGTGHWLRFFIDEIGVGYATGIEISTTAVQKLERRFVALDNIRIHLADISTEDLDLGERFDIVNAIGVMFHIVDDRAWSRSITNIAKHLKLGGVAIIGGKFDCITRNVHFTKTDEFSSWDQFRNENAAGKDRLLVYKRLRSKRMWRRTLKENECTVVDVIPAHCRIHTPQNNVLVFRKLLC